MRHRVGTVKLGRASKHREAMLANLLASLIQHGRIMTTLAKAKAARPMADKLVTLAKRNDIHSRRVATARLKGKETIVARLFKEVAPKQAERAGGYTRIIKLGNRIGDAAPMAFLEFVEPAGQQPGAVDELKELEKKIKKAEKSKKAE